MSKSAKVVLGRGLGQGCIPEYIGGSRTERSMAGKWLRKAAAYGLFTRLAAKLLRGIKVAYALSSTHQTRASNQPQGRTLLVRAGKALTRAPRAY